MSVDHPSADAIHDKQNEIARVVLSRKRKLIELYTVASSADALSALRPPLDGQQPPALELFLQHNDIEQGCYFEDVTLPPFYQFASKLSSSLSTSPRRTTPRSQTSSTSPQKLDTSSHETRVHELPTIAQTAEYSNPDTPHLLRNSSRRLSASQDSSLNGPTDTDRPRTVMHFSGVVVDGSRPSSRQRSPRLTLQAEPFPRAAALNPSRPVSPPYSPGTEPTGAGPSQAGDDLGTAGHDGPMNVLTPRRDNLDGLDSARAGGQHSGFGVPVGPSLNDRLDHAENSQGFIPQKDLHQNDATLISPTDTSRSVCTARTIAQSSAATSEEDVPPQKEVARSTPPMDQEHAAAKPSTSHSVAQKQPGNASVFSSDIAGLESQRGPTEAKIALTPPEQRNHASLDQPSAKKRAMAIDHLSGMGVQRTANDSMSRSNTAASDRDDAEATAMDIDQPKATSIPTPSTRVRHPEAKDRVRKRRHNRGVRRLQFVISKSADDRYLDTVRALRSEQALKQMGSQSYLKPLIAHQVLNAENFKALDHLLMGTSKAVATSDFMASIREEQDLRVLERTRNLQQSLRWSLRQPKPSVEPPQPHCHWDVVLANMKWLRTDFREEAKFRTAVAKTLAEWCAEYFEASEDERRSLRVRSRPTRLSAIASSVSGTEARSEATATPATAIFNAEWLSGDSGINYLAAEPGQLACNSLRGLRFSDDVLEKFPIYEPQKLFRTVSDIILRATLEQADAEEGILRLPGRKSVAEQSEGADETRSDEEEEPPLPPENTSCALFDPESRPLRARLTAPWVFKPPTAPMPPQTFYEHRSASQWNWEDDQLLKQYTKDFPSNWPLISDRMMPKSHFTTYIDRRTPWECYERLLAMEGPPADAQARQYLRHFSYRLEKARESFDKHQNAIREAAEQHAQNAGQPAPVLPQKRFPTPMRVDRKPQKRFLAMLDCARKLARKREQNAAKQQSQAQPDAQAQKAAPARPQQNQTPQYFSRMKYEAELKEQERLQSLRDQQRAILEAQRRPQGGQQAHLTNGIGQQMRQRVASGQANPAGQLPVTANNQAQARQMPPQINPPLNLPNGLAAANVQLALNARPQANMQGQQRIAPLINGQAATNVDAMRMVQQMQQQQRNYQMSQQQHGLQNQFARMSPNVTGANGITSASVLAAFSNGSNNYPLSTLGLSDSTASLPQQLANGTATRVSPHIAQVAAFQNSAQPQSLSSGHVTAINNLEHQIRSQNPNMSSQDVRHLATVQLKQAMTSMQRQNAINGALSAATGAHAQGQQTLPIMRTGGGGAQSPFPLAPQLPVSTPQMTQAQPQQQQHSPYQTNGMLSTPSTLSHTSVRGHSPVNLPANMAGSPQLLPQQPQQSAYSAQLRQQMFAQQQAQRQHQLSLSAAGAMAAASGSPPAAQASPALPMAMPANVNVNAFVSAGVGLNRTPSAQSLGSLGSGMMGVGVNGGGLQPSGGQGTGGAGQSMRPPSRSASAMGLDPAAAAQFQQQLAAAQGQQRVVPSPSPGAARPVSSGGFTGQ